MDSESEEEYVYEEEDTPKPSSVRKYEIEECSVISESTQGNIERRDSHSSRANKFSAVVCEKCGEKFMLDRKASIIKCINCGGRILLKMRTKNSIYYSSD